MGNHFACLGDIFVYKVCYDSIHVPEVKYMLAGEVELLLIVFLQCDLSQK